MANTFSANVGGQVSLGNKTMIIGTASFPDGAATAVDTPFTNLQSVAFMTNSGTAIEQVTFATGAFTVATAASGDLHHCTLIGT